MARPTDPAHRGTHATPAPPGSPDAADTPSGRPSTPPDGPRRAIGTSAPGGLTAQEREVLAFERDWWQYAGAKDAAIRERLGLSAPAYYQALNAVIDRPDALAADPLLVRRLRRMRVTRQRERSARRSR